MRRSCWRAMLVIAVAGGLASEMACKPVSFYRRPPNLRGVTVPLPPPTFLGQQDLLVSIEGALRNPSQHPGTKAYVWEDHFERGYFRHPDEDTGEFLFEEVMVRVGGSCLSTYYVDGEDDQASAESDYKVELRVDPELCEDPACSAQDDEGACVCLVKWSTGCS